MTKYQVVIIGAGHNGLVTAAYLAKAGVQVAVLERRPLLGGVAVTEELYPGFRVDSVLHNAGTLRPQIVKDLFLKMHGLVLFQPDALVFAPLPDGKQLTLWRDVDRTAAEIGHFSPKDGARFVEYSQMLARYAGFAEIALARVPPDIGQLNAANLLPWLDVGRRFKGLGGSDMYGLLRILPMSLAEFLPEWFEDEAVKGVMAAPGITGIQQGPYSSGTAFVLLYHHLGYQQPGLPGTQFVYGGIGQLAEALASSARHFGATICPNAPVNRIQIRNGRAAGVILEDGETIEAGVVVSGANPRHTFIDLIDPMELPPTFLRAINNIKFRGSVAKVNLALSGLPTFTALPDGDTSRLHGRIQISPSLAYLEKAYDAAKYGRFSERPYLDIRIPSLADPSLAPPGQHVMSILVQYAPYHLRVSNWETQRPVLADTVVETLGQYAPDIKDLILYCQVLTPADLEATYGLAEGSVYHGELMLDQLLFMRPVPGYGQYRTPIGGLYLCGAGAHPGGGITGEPGRLAAQVILKDRS
ncbi:MAG TPA: NAD(P)/FAD-dependent oxidoreductase [Anaerolineae bacterium]